jgi:adenylyltransferase/sulfurtransferase
MRRHSDSAWSPWPSDWRGHLNTDKVDSWEISPRELKSLLDRGEPVLIVDVREPWEAEVVSLPNSRLIPLGELRFRADEEIDFDEDIVVYCHHGVRSLEAAMILWELGYESVKSLAGGIHRWSVQVDSSLPQY